MKQKDTEEKQRGNAVSALSNSIKAITMWSDSLHIGIPNRWNNIRICRERIKGSDRRDRICSAPGIDNIPTRLPRGGK